MASELTISRSCPCSPRRERGTRLIAWLAVLMVFASVGTGALAEEGGAAAKSEAAPKYSTERLRGKVVWLEDALKRRYGVSTEPDAAKTSVVLEMSDGTLLPIVPDTWGRAFAVDKRLRDTQLELLVRRYEKVPLVQVIRVMRPTNSGLLELDYWCDVCAIPMHILKPCECCQGPTRLRERPVEEVFQP
jgi:hypothetical protein